jgi:alpha-aminoadipate carrier protein LysW
MMKTRCPDCNVEIDVPQDVMLGEILSCPCCGLELEVKKVNEKSVEIQELALEGEDWGE